MNTMEPTDLKPLRGKKKKQANAFRRQEAKPISDITHAKLALLFLIKRCRFNQSQ